MIAIKTKEQVALNCLSLQPKLKLSNTKSYNQNKKTRHEVN